MRKAITYYRVSTDRQEESKLGLEAQEEAVKLFAATRQYELIDEYVEVESGTWNERPLLRKALAACRRKRAVLLIAKLDRLGRSVAFITTLMEAGVEFQAIDYPDADKVIIQIMAVFAEYERDQISQRTKAALAVAKAQGVELGKNGKYVLSRRNRERAKQFVVKMTPVIDRLREKGITTIRGIRDELNRMRIPTYHNNKWHIGTVHSLVTRINDYQNDNKSTNNLNNTS